jgi:hypothetical protein
LNFKILRFIAALIDEEEFQQNKLRPHELDPTRLIEEKPRLKKYINNDAAIYTLVEAFGQTANHLG